MNLPSKLPRDLNIKELNFNNITSYLEVKNLQNELSRRVITKDDYIDNVELVCGVDVSYRKKTAYCSAVIINKEKFEIVETVNSKSEIKNPYIPGLFILRESSPILQTLRLITRPFQLLLVDGHGVLHPRRCGLACYIGIVTNIPTIGVAKSLLCGGVQSDNFVTHKSEILGYALKFNENSKKVAYISVGHKISLLTSIELVKSITKINQYIPEPLRIADKLSKELDYK